MLEPGQEKPECFYISLECPLKTLSYTVFSRCSRMLFSTVFLKKYA